MNKTLISSSIAAALSLGVASAQADTLNIDSWTLGSFSGLISDFAFAGPPGGPSTNPDKDNTFGPDPEAGCGGTCGDIIFGQANATNTFTTGFNFGGTGAFQPEIFANIAGTLDTSLVTGTNDGQAVTFTALDFGGFYNGNTFQMPPDTLNNCTGDSNGFFTCGQVAQSDIDGSFGAYVGDAAGYNVLLTDNGGGDYGIEVSYVGTIQGSGTSFDTNEANWRLRGEIHTSAIPVPAAVWLFGSGLVGLVGVARRRKITAS